MERPINRDFYLEYVKTLLPDNPKILEIGVEAGHLSKKLMKVFEPSELHLLDPWEWNPSNGKIYQQSHMNGVPTAHSNVHMQIEIERLFAKEIRDGVVFTHRGYSSDLVDNFQDGYFDFIYIDGSHIARDVLTDACVAWPMLNIGGVMCFDDYEWGEPIPETHKPKLAIDAFINIFQEDLEVIHKGYQLIV